MILKRSLILLCSVFCYLLVAAQVPSDLSGVKASQVSNAQLQQMLAQAKASGMTMDQLETELLRRGLPQSELEALKLRIENMEYELPAAMDSTVNKAGTLSDQKRVYNGKTQPDIFSGLIPKKPRIFGAELFSNTNLTFEPDLRMPTPKNYTIGPEDELILHIYGVNISQQTLKVSPDGTVNVKYAGIVHLNGITIDAATALLKTRLSTYYPGLKNGQTRLELTLGNIRSIRVVLIGAIKRPGTYTLPSLATLFNALYSSGGPQDNGSFRKIELIRNNKVVQVADLYDFLLKGSQASNVRLEDNDVIRVPFADMLVTLNGQVNREGIFELNDNESLLDVVRFAGGFKSWAYRGRITGKRIGNFERQVLDVSGDSLAYFRPHNGDEFLIDSVINRFENRVIINGAVFKPGAYALTQGLTLRGLIEKAQGLREDVFDGRAIVVRTAPDFSKQYISVDLRPVMEGTDAGLPLIREDSIHVASIFDLRDSAIVTINGAVRKPGTFRFEKGLSLKSLVIKADGFADNATGRGIEISRRKRDIDISRPGSSIAEIIRIDDTTDLRNSNKDFELKPFDIVTVKEDPFYRKQISVRISGEVLSPAVYTLQSREERLSSLISRAGGLLYTANIGGAKLVRKKKEVADTSELKRLFASLEKDTSGTASRTVVKNTTDVAINLKYVLEHPGSADDITLEEGDELIIPRINNTVGISGEVFKPLDIMYEKGKSMRDYINDAGGATPAGSKRRAFLIYPNGSSAKIKRPLGIFSNYPKVTPGSNIFIPQKPKRDGFDVGKAGIFISAITALITATALIVR